jgi:hypothetical protein
MGKSGMVWLCALTTIATLVFFSWLTCTTGDPHWVQRGGALLAAFAAMLAVFEAFFEQKAEVIKRDAIELPAMTPVGRLALRIKNARMKSNLGIVSEQKLRTVFYISMVAVFGELLHGFGDLLACNVFGICVAVPH